MESDAPTTRGIELLVSKESLSQRNNGAWHLKLAILSPDMDQGLALAAIGTRFSCLLIEVEDDAPAPDPKATVRQAWRELDAVKQAAIRCTEPVFWAFLSEEMFGGALRIAGEEGAARVVREHCGVESRSDLGLPGKDEARERWRKLDGKFQAWMAKENA